MIGPIPRKTVYLNEIAIGQASTWTEVYALLRAKGVRFIGRPGAAEGPTGFYVHASLVRPIAQEPETEDGATRSSSDACD